MKPKSPTIITVQIKEPPPGSQPPEINLAKLKEILAAIQEIKKHRPELFQS